MVIHSVPQIGTVGIFDRVVSSYKHASKHDNIYRNLRRLVLSAICACFQPLHLIQ